MDRHTADTTRAAQECAQACRPKPGGRYLSGTHAAAASPGDPSPAHTCLVCLSARQIFLQTPSHSLRAQHKPRAASAAAGSKLIFHAGEAGRDRSLTRAGGQPHGGQAMTRRPHRSSSRERSQQHSLMLQSCRARAWRRGTAGWSHRKREARLSSEQPGSGLCSKGLTGCRAGPTPASAAQQQDRPRRHGVMDLLPRWGESRAPACGCVAGLWGGGGHLSAGEWWGSGVGGTHLSATHASPSCLGTRSPPRSCPLCPCQFRICHQSLWSNLEPRKVLSETCSRTQRPGPWHLQEGPAPARSLGLRATRDRATQRGRACPGK